MNDKPDTKKLIIENRKARFNYEISENLEAGIILEGWEIKAIRSGKVQMTEGYCRFIGGAIEVVGIRIEPLKSASSHVSPIADRPRKLLLNKAEIKKLSAKVEQKGYTLIPIDLHFRGGRVKLEIALAKGKNQQDKRQTLKDRDWSKEQGQLTKSARISQS